MNESSFTDDMMIYFGLAALLATVVVLFIEMILDSFKGEDE